MKALAVFGLTGGLAFATILVLSNGVGSIWHSATLLGVHGFAVVVAFHLCLIGLMGAAWWLLGRARRDTRLGQFVWGRLVRDSGSEALPLSQIGGYVLGARAVALTGVSGAFAAASTVVDISAELVAQIAYTLLGLLLLDRLRPNSAFAAPVLTGIVVMSIVAVIFIAVQARGAAQAERLLTRLARTFLGRTVGEAGAVQGGIRQIHRKPAVLALAVLLHFAAWALSGVETWLTLRLMAIPVSPQAALTIDSLLYGMRSVAFIVPNSFGVQEGALVLLGAMFGIGADTALALSLVKRARDLAIGAPALLAWQILEGRRAWSQEMPINATKDGQLS